MTHLSRSFDNIQLREVQGRTVSSRRRWMRFVPIADSWLSGRGCLLPSSRVDRSRREAKIPSWQDKNEGGREGVEVGRG